MECFQTVSLALDLRQHQPEVLTETDRAPGIRALSSLLLPISDAFLEKAPFMRITQTVTFMPQLIKEIAAGHAIPAAIQRPYVWGPEDVIALCDSIASLFPIGGILTWRPSSDILTRVVSKPRLGPIHPNSDAPAGRLILDGQNRLATLAWIIGSSEDSQIHDPSTSEAETWLSGKHLVYDWEKRSFLFVEGAQAEAGMRLPVRAAFSGSMAIIRDKYQKWVDQGFSDSRIEEFLTHWDEISRGFQEVRIVETCLENASPAEAKHAFLRICRTGVPMTEEDFDTAANWLAEKPATK
jgi:hypothetical protein